MSYYRVIRITVNFTALLVLAFSFYFYYLGDIFRGNAGIISFLGLLTPSFIYRKTWMKKVFHREILSVAEVLLTTAIILNSLGAVWLYYESRFMTYDTFVHFLGPILLVPGMALIYLLDREFVNKKATRKGAIIFGLIGTILFILAWEIFEILGDRAWGSVMSIQIGQSYDVVRDLLAGFISLPIGVVIVYKYFDFCVKQWKK